MKDVLKNYFDIVNRYWEKDISYIVDNEDVINILDFYIKNEKLHIDMSKSGWTNDNRFIIILNDNKNNKVGYISLSQDKCNVVYKSTNSFDQFTLNKEIDGYFSDLFNINGNNIENITEFNSTGIFLSNGVVPYLCNNITSKFSEAFSIHKNINEKIDQKVLIKTYKKETHSC